MGSTLGREILDGHVFDDQPVRAVEAEQGAVLGARRAPLLGVVVGADDERLAAVGPMQGDITLVRHVHDFVVGPGRDGDGRGGGVVGR